jgi:SNF2 family DNA or RNA helicase
MRTTDYQAKYFAYDLTRRCAPDSAERLAGAVAGAQVDLNPHQVDAALFAFASPLSKGALLADEVGLGKTIEAGLVISQRWAERRRRVLIIVPSNLRKQWHQELSEKFFLPCAILETKSYNQAVKAGNFRPFDIKDTVVICSYQFARNKASDVHAAPWDLVVIDEAHRLRNVYKPSNVIANTLKLALAQKQKLLLTATPLQNSLLELFGLVSFIDEQTFGDLTSFREQFANTAPDRVLHTLRARLTSICHRTLRRQVTAYVPFTRRHPIVEEFTPEDGEDKLYELVSEYLRRDNLQALPAGQRSLMTLVLRKLLASSTFAIAGALTSISQRLQAKIKRHDATALEDDLGEDYESLDATAEEWTEDEVIEPLTEADRRAIEAEISDLNEFARLATSIEHNGKGKALLKALGVAFAKAEELGAAKKAIVFTESRRTQGYLLRVLADSPYADGIVLFNGTNTDERSKQVYAQWFARHEGSDRISGSKTADMRSALVDYFRESGRIMIATEAGAEGINLQFCSLVVNYDLPWNPQRIEQRIGRCHRYGQKHDVVVVNFLNRKNEADQRVYQLLSEKFKLFEGVFGASDEVLGAIESGVDFEKRIGAIYQQCRQTSEIRSAFDQLQLELSLEINETMGQTRMKLLENFDDEVREKLKVRDEDSKAFLSRFEQLLMRLTRHELNGNAEFLSGTSFRLNSRPTWTNGRDVPLGLYELPRRSGDAHLYRMSHPLGESIIQRAKSRDLNSVEITFDYTNYSGKISVLEPLRGRTGWLTAAVLTVDALDTSEDHILLSGIADDGETLNGDVVMKFSRSFIRV